MGGIMDSNTVKGAEYGSVVPGFGTAAGALIGGAMDLFGSKPAPPPDPRINDPKGFYDRDGSKRNGYDPNQFQFGHDPNYADQRAGVADASMAHNDAQEGMAQKGMGWGMGQMQGAHSRGATAIESQQLANNEAGGKAWQQDATGLARNAAYGNAPSEAAYMMQSGLDQGLRDTASQGASARGGAAMALAQGNAAGNAASMEQQTFGAAGRLRAQEMAQARDQYGQLTTAGRGQDQARLGQGNDMARYNAGANDSYALGSAGAAQGFGQLGNAQNQSDQGWFGQGTGIYGSQLGAGMHQQDLIADTSQHEQDRAAGISSAQRTADVNEQNGYLSAGSTLVGAAAKMA